MSRSSATKSPAPHSRPCALFSPRMMVQKHAGTAWSDEQLQSLARRFSVSRFVVLRGLLTAGRTTAAFYKAKHEEWIAAARVQAAKRESEGGPPPDRAAIAESGQTFVRLVLQSYYQDRITLSDVPNTSASG